LAWSGAVFFALSHGLSKAAAFLAAGSLLHALGTDRLEALHGAGRRFPMTSLAFAVAGVNLMGLPPTGGFIGKWMLLKAAFATGQWAYAGVMVAGGLLAAAYIFRVLERLMAAPPEPGAAPTPAPVPAGERWTALALALAAVLLAVATAGPIRLLPIDAPVAISSFAPTGERP